MPKLTFRSLLGRVSKALSLPARPPAHAQSSFCASLNGEVLEKVCDQSQGLNRAPG